MKRLIIGAVLLLLLGVVAFFMMHNNAPTTVRTELADFAIENPDNVTRVVLKNERGEQITLEKQANHWTVNSDYKARPDAVEILLKTMSDLSIKSPVSQNTMATILKNIIAQHTLVSVYSGGADPIKEYYVGGSNQLHTGTNMMMKGSSRPFVVHIEGFHGFLTPRFFTNEREWRARDIFEVDPDSIDYLSITYRKVPQKNFTIAKSESGAYLVSAGENNTPVVNYDTLMLNAYLSEYKMVHYESYEETKSDAYIDSVKQSEPAFKIELHANGIERIVKAFPKPLTNGSDLEGNTIEYDVDRLYLLVDSGDLFVGQYAVFDKLTKGVYFLDETR